MKRPRIHDLRHTHASWMLAEGMDMFTLSRRLGHETCATTDSRYSHLMPAQRQRLPRLDLQVHLGCARCAVTEETAQTPPGPRHAAAGCTTGRRTSRRSTVSSLAVLDGLGGDSLMATGVAANIAAVLGVPYDSADLLADRTISEIGYHVDELLDGVEQAGEIR